MSLVEATALANATSFANPLSIPVTATIQSGDVIVVGLAHYRYDSNSVTWTVTGGGVTLTSRGRAASSALTTNQPVIEFFTGTATGDADVQVTRAGTTWRGMHRVWVLRGIAESDIDFDAVYDSSTGETFIQSTAITAGPDQAVIVFGGTNGSGNGGRQFFRTYEPSTGWTSSGESAGSFMVGGTAHRIPGSSASHYVADGDVPGGLYTKTYTLARLRIGAVASAGATGNIAASLPALTGSVTGVVPNRGTVSGTLPQLTGSVVGQTLIGDDLTRRLVGGDTDGMTVASGAAAVVSGRFASTVAGTQVLAATDLNETPDQVKVSGIVKVDKTAGRFSYVGVSTVAADSITTSSATAEIGHLAGSGIVMRSQSGAFTTLGLVDEAGLTDGDEYLVTLVYTGGSFADPGGSDDHRWSGWAQKVDGSAAPYTASNSTPADRVWDATPASLVARTNSAVGTLRDVVYSRRMFAVDPGFGQYRAFPYYGTAGERMGIWTRGLSDPLRLVVFIGGTTSYGGWNNLMGYPLAGSPRDDYRTVIHALVEAGYTVITPNALHPGWGSDEAIGSTLEAIADLVAAVGASDHELFYLSYSMGGVQGWRALLGRASHPDVTAFYSIAGVADLDQFVAGATYDNPVDATGAELIATGTRVRSVIGTSDTNVPKAEHHDLMAALYAGDPLFESDVIDGASHFQAVYWDGADVVTFFDDAAGGSVGALGVAAGDLPALTGDVAGVTYRTGTIAGTLPALTGAVDGYVDIGADTGDIAGVLPALTGELFGDIDAEPVALALAEVVVEAFAVVELSPAADIDVAVPILSEKHPAPVLSASQPMHQAHVDYTPTTDIVGYAHLWVDGVDVTYFRDQPVLIRNWTSEAPWGDKTALWEMPQLDEWDVPGEGDLSWLRPDAPVVIGIVDLDGVVHRKWSGFYHSRTTGFDSARDFVFEAHGGMWAAMWQTYEPPPYQKPIDIGRLVPRLLNKVIGRRWNPIPETTTGILTRYRGSRDQKIWQAVQDILAEAWTEDGRQWTLVQVSDDEYRLRLKADPATSVDGTFAYGNPAVDVDVTVDEDSRVDIVKCRGIGERGGAWANVKYPGVEILNGLPYPNSDAGDFINPGETDASTTSGTGVTDWQTKVRDLGYTTLAVSGVMSSDWVDVVYRVQRDLSLSGVDGQIGPETWTATFNEINEDIDLTPIRLPMAKKSAAWPWKHAANGAILGPNPNYDPQMIPREVALDLGPGVNKAEGFKIARTYLAVNGDPVVTGRMSFRGCLDDLARTDLTVGSNVKVNGYLGRDVAVQLGRVSVDLDTDSGGVYVVSADVDERARDALTIDQILARNRDALPDPARRPGNPNRSSRQVRDEGFSWDAESPCGVLTRTAVNGDAGYWSRKTIPFAEVGQLAGIRLHSTVPFAFAIFATLRMTPRKMRQLMPGGPFSSTDPWRPIMDTLEGTYGLLGAWGAQDDACGYGGGMESDGYSFTGEFIESNTLEYITETPPYVDVFLFARGDSGFVWGDFLPARQT